jgi:hypothetical protein
VHVARNWVIEDWGYRGEDGIVYDCRPMKHEVLQKERDRESLFHTLMLIILISIILSGRDHVYSFCYNSSVKTSNISCIECIKTKYNKDSTHEKFDVST